MLAEQSRQDDSLQKNRSIKRKTMDRDGAIRQLPPMMGIMDRMCRLCFSELDPTDDGVSVFNDQTPSMSQKIFIVFGVSLVLPVPHGARSTAVRTSRNVSISRIVLCFNAVALKSEK